MKMKRKSAKTKRTIGMASKPDPNRYPKGWDRQRVGAVISHYENQSEDEAVAEDQAAFRSTNSTMIQVPAALVSKVEKLIARAS